MKQRLTYFALALMGLGILSAIPLAQLGYEIFAGIIFVAGMLMLWVAATANFMRRLVRHKRNDR